MNNTKTFSFTLLGLLLVVFTTSCETDDSGNNATFSQLTAHTWVVLESDISTDIGLTFTFNADQSYTITDLGGLEYFGTWSLSADGLELSMVDNTSGELSRYRIAQIEATVLYLETITGTILTWRFEPL